MTVVTSMSDGVSILVAKDVFDPTKVGIEDRDLVQKFSSRISSGIMVETKADLSAMHQVLSTHKSELPATISHSEAE
jgi:hypothetical protein